MEVTVVAFLLAKRDMQVNTSHKLILKKMRSVREQGYKQDAKVGKWRLLAFVYTLMVVFLLLPAVSIAQTYHLRLLSVDGNQQLLNNSIKIPLEKQDGVAAFGFIQTIVPALQERGYLAASVDSIAVDSGFYTAFIYLGQLFKWGQVSFDGIPQGIMVQAGINKEQWGGRMLNPKQISKVSERLLRWAENNGYPFARVWLETTSIQEAGVNGRFMLDKGPERKIDSVAIHTDVRVSRGFIMRSLDLKKGEYYNEHKPSIYTCFLNRCCFQPA